MPSSPFRAELTLKTGWGSSIGDTRIRLLEAIDAHGSISQAAKAVPLAYKSAWDAVDEMNNLAEQPLVARTVGGARGGGTRLTAHGQQLVAFYRALQTHSQAATDRLLGQLPLPDGDDGQAVQRLLQRMAVRTSARNQFVCTVSRLHAGPVNTQVHLALDKGMALEAQVTGESVTQLGLRPGQTVLALIKASAVTLLADPALRTSASNHLAGTIDRLHAGPVNCELVVRLDAEVPRHVTAVVTTESVQALGLAEGGRVGAVFQATSVMLAVLD